MPQSPQQRQYPRSCSSSCSSSNRQSRPWPLVLPAGRSNRLHPPKLQLLLLQFCQRRQAYRRSSNGEQNVLLMTVPATRHRVQRDHCCSRRRSNLFPSLRLLPLVRVLQAPVKRSVAAQVASLQHPQQHQSHSHPHVLLQQPHQKGALVLQLWPLWAPARQCRGTRLRHRSRRRALRPRHNCNLQPGRDHQISHQTCLQRGLEHHLWHLRQPVVVGRCSHRLHGLRFGVPVRHPPVLRHLLTCPPQQPLVQPALANQPIPQG